MAISDEEKQKLFERMDREWKTYYRAREDEIDAVMPHCPPELWVEFRAWQQGKLHQKLADYDAEKQRRQRNQGQG